jgi:hypothetical protein
MKGAMIASVVLISVVFLVPFAPLSLPLAKVKREAILAYGNVVGHHGRLVHKRWIEGEEIGSPPILAAPELGPVADVQTMFDSVRRIRLFAVGKMGFIAIAVPAALPMLYVAAMQFPLQTILAKVLKRYSNAANQQ